MTDPLLIILVGFLFVLFLGGLSWMRREGLPVRFAIEAIVFTLVVGGLSYTTGVQVDILLFMIVLYILTMRVRLLVDLANIFARSGKFSVAEKIYAIGLAIGPDPTNRMIVQINQGVAYLLQRRLEEAIQIFKQVLSEVDSGHLGVKHESACHYNLALAYQKNAQIQAAKAEYQATLDTWPVSEYGRRAHQALERLHATPEEP